MSFKLGLHTIGQTPRPDITQDIKPLLPGFDIVESGALDGFSREEARQFAPKDGEPLYITRLADGSDIQIAKKAAGVLLQEKINDLDKDNRVDMHLMFCTGDFDGLHSQKVPLYESSKLMKETVVQEAKGKLLGIVIPDKNQRPQMEARWSLLVERFCMESCLPYKPTADSQNAIEAFVKQDVDLILLDCVGFTTAMGLHFKSAGKPVIVPREVLCKKLINLCK